MGITEAIRAYLENYPGLSGGVMHVDWLPESARAYSIESIPCEPVLKQYMDGSSWRQLQFNLASSMYYSSDVENQTENMEWFEAFDGWIQMQSLFRQLPELGEGRVCKTIEILSSAYPVAVDDNGLARYQLQMKITYLQEGIL